MVHGSVTGKIGHINVEGSGQKEFSLPTGSHPQGITVGPDGDLWFVDQKASGLFTVGKITVAGVITEYPVGLNAGPFQAFGNVAQITAGPDRNLWFVNPQLNSAGTYLVGRITTAGAISTFVLADTPLGICAGPFSFWIIEGVHVAKITISGVETETRCLALLSDTRASRAVPTVALMLFALSLPFCPACTEFFHKSACSAGGGRFRVLYENFRCFLETFF